MNGGLGGYNRPKGSGASSFLVFSPAVVVAHGWARTLDVRVGSGVTGGGTGFKIKCADAVGDGSG